VFLTPQSLQSEPTEGRYEMVDILAGISTIYGTYRYIDEQIE
jgi:hypothetical protein